MLSSKAKQGGKKALKSGPPREKTLEPWYICKKRNKWPEWLHLGYRDVVLQSVDQNKSGFTQQNEQAPTNDSQTAKAFSV